MSFQLWDAKIKSTNNTKFKNPFQARSVSSNLAGLKIDWWLFDGHKNFGVNKRGTLLCNGAIDAGERKNDHKEKEQNEGL